MNIIFKPECKTEIIEPTYDLPIIGEPISKTGASANNSNAYGVIVGIIGDGSSRRVRVRNPIFASVYTTDYSETAESYGHPSNLAHEQLIAPEFMELLKRMLLTA